MGLKSIDKPKISLKDLEEWVNEAKEQIEVSLHQRGIG